MKNLLIIALLFISISSNSQIDFEQGYFIKNNGEIEKCLIKNFDWKNNPIDIVYKKLATSKRNVITISEISEFGIDNISKFIRDTVDIDRSSENLANMSNKRNPTFKKEILFLKVLVEGSASLYVYKDRSLLRFFFSKSGQPLKQLIYKSYLTINKKIGKNENYKQQLINNLNCSGVTYKSIEKLKYKNKGLINIFSKFNECENSDFTNFGKNDDNKILNLSVKIGLKYSTLDLNNSVSYTNLKFKNQLGLSLGVELEYILPFNKNIWGIIIEPTYQYFKTDKLSNGRSQQTFKAIVNYSSIELPIGLRHNIFLRNNSKIFINGAYIFDVNIFNSKIEYLSLFASNLNLDIRSRHNYMVGFGFINNKVSVEFRIQTTRDLLTDYFYWRSKYNTASVIFGYNL